MRCVVYHEHCITIPSIAPEAGTRRPRDNLAHTRRREMDVLVAVRHARRIVGRRRSIQRPRTRRGVVRHAWLICPYNAQAVLR